MVITRSWNNFECMFSKFSKTVTKTLSLEGEECVGSEVCFAFILDNTSQCLVPQQLHF